MKGIRTISSFVFWWSSESVGTLLESHGLVEHYFALFAVTNHVGEGAADIARYGPEEKRPDTIRISGLRAVMCGSASPLCVTPLSPFPMHWREVFVLYGPTLKLLYLGARIDR